MGTRKSLLKQIALTGIGVVIGVIIGGYLFSRSQPRSVLALNNCQGTCLQANELVGLAASVGINRFTTVLPNVIAETDKTVVLKHPSPNAPVHYVVVPKKDIKNIADISPADGEYLVDMFAVAGEMIRRESLTNYQLISNGPDGQGVTYLHFHLMAR